MPVASCSICFEDLLSTNKRQSKSEQNQKLDRCKKEASKELSDSVSSTPCGHVFHSVCVSQWVTQHQHCPQCRATVHRHQLKKLFLAEDGANSVKGAQKAQIRNRFDTYVVIPSEEQSGGSDESRIIQDVLQCQVDDLEAQVKHFKKQIMTAEDHINEKVQEISAVEAELLAAKRKEEHLEKLLDESRKKDCKNEVHSELEKSFAALERDNADLRNQLYSMREQERKKDLEMREHGHKVEQSEENVRRMQAEMRAKDTIIRGLETQLDHLHHLDYSIYESVDDHLGRPPPKGRISKCANVGKCVKNAFIICIVVSVILGVFVILPLKLIFVETEETRRILSEQNRIR